MRQDTVTLGGPSGPSPFPALLLAFLVGCGGGGGNETPGIPPPLQPALETVRDYWLTFGSYFRGTLVRESDRAVYAQWEVRDGVADWGGVNREVTRIVTCKDGKEYVVLFSFDDLALGNSYPLTDFRTELARDGGPWQDITNLCGPKGVVYMPVAVPAFGTLKLRQWGHVAATKAFYWESHWEYGVYEYNPCWSKGAESRKAVVQQELWWDAGDFGKPGGAWARGRGFAVPWQQGRPVDIGVSTMIHRITIAKGAGVGWTVNEPSADLSTITRLCLLESEYRA